MEEQQRVTGGQLVMLLVLSRVFTLLTYTPKASSAAEGSIILGSMLLSSVGYLALLYVSEKVVQISGGKDVLGAVAATSGKLYIVVAALYWIFFVLSAASSVSQFEFFLTATLYNEGNIMIFLILCIGVAGYCAYMGLSALGRLSFFVMVAFALSIICVGVALYKDIRLVEVVSPFSKGIETYIKSAYQNGFFNIELILIPVLCTNTTSTTKKIGRMYVGSTLVLFFYLVFMVLTTLGDFATTQMFPVYSMMSIAQLSVLERMDFFHIAIWVFIVVIRISLYLIVANKMFCSVFTVQRKSALLIALASTFAVSLILSLNLELLNVVNMALGSGVAILVFLIIIPLMAILFCPKRRISQ